jgi:CRP/FNR family transcriptional regulator/CRP/FNR family cyclic AMP-dependent transcriptional regulator
MSATAAQPDTDLLRNIPLFAGLADGSREELGSLLQSRQYVQNQPIFWIGEKGEEMFIVQHGKVILSYPDESGHEITVAALGPGAFFGELSLLDGGSRTATARTSVQSTLLVLDRKGFYKFLEAHPSASVHLIATLAHRHREAMDKLRGVKNINEEIKERITPLQRLVDRAAAFTASGWFLLGNIIFFIAWMVAFTLFALRSNTDFSLIDSPPTFAILAFCIGLESMLMTMFILNSQNRQSERDRIKADFEYQVNLKAQYEVMQLHSKIDRLEQMLGKPSSGDSRET